MGASVRPDGGSRIERNIAALRQQGASEHDIEAYLTQHEGMKPSAPAAPRPGLGERVMSGIGGALSHMVEHPVETAKSLVTAPLKSAADAFLTPEVGEQRPDPKLVAARFGGIPQQPAPAYDEAHGAQPVGGRTRAGIQTVVNAAFPRIASGVGGRVAAAGAAPFVARTAGMSAAGGAAGAAYSPDDPAAGAIAGAILAPVVGETGRGIGKAGGKIATALSLRPTGRTAAELAQDAATMRAPVGPQAGAASATPFMEAVPGREPLPTSNPAPTNTQRLRAVFGRGAEKAGVESSKKLALRLVDQRFALDNVTPADAVAYVGQNAKKPLAALDLGAGNVSGLARTAKDVPGLGRRIIPEMLHERSAGKDGATMQRITQDFEDRIGLKPEDYYKSREDMVGEMKSTAKKNYDKVRNTVVDDPEVLSLFDEPEFQAIHERIRSNARLGGKEKIPALSTTEEIGGEKVRSLNPQSLGTLDKVKRQLDKIIAGKSESVGTVDRDLAFNMRERVNAILDRMDELHPDYGKARAQYRGSAEGIDAYESGKLDFGKDDPRLTVQKLAKMPERVRDLYRRGQYDALRTRLSKMDDGANIGAFLEKNPDIRAKVAALAKSPEESVALRGDLGTERAMGERKNQILGGPNSAERLIEHWSTTPMVTHIGNVARKVPLIGNIGGGAVDNILTRRASNQTGDVMGEVAKYLTRTGPEGVQTLLDEIAALKLADKRAASIPRLKTGYVAATRSGQKPKRD